MITWRLLLSISASQPVPILTLLPHRALLPEHNGDVSSRTLWAEGVCVDNGVVAGLLAEDFQGTSPKGARFTKADELKDEKVHTQRTIAELTRLRYVFWGAVLPLLMAPNMPWAKTSHSRV